MPTYQYACTACGHQLEAVQSFADEPLTECPACAGRLRKLFSAVGIVFKGSGFYRNDSRSGSASGENGSAQGKDAPAEEARARKPPARPSESPSSSASSDSNSGGGSTSAARPQPPLVPPNRQDLHDHELTVAK